MEMADSYKRTRARSSQYHILEFLAWLRCSRPPGETGLSTPSPDQQTSVPSCRTAVYHVLCAEKPITNPVNLLQPAGARKRQFPAERGNFQVHQMIAYWGSDCLRSLSWGMPQALAAHPMAMMQPWWGEEKKQCVSDVCASARTRVLEGLEGLDRV